MNIRSKLPEVGTTIFTQMSALAGEHGAINLSQGFPDYPCDPALISALAEAAAAGHNQYAPMTGLPALREAIAAKLESQHGQSFDPASEITITAGATQALFTSIAAILHAGDEALVLDPSYDSYAPAIHAQGAHAIRIRLPAPDFRPDWALIDQHVTSRTRLILINNPNNPATTNLPRADLDALADLAERHDLLVLADEVYEHLVFDGQTHRSVLAHPRLRSRAMAVYSFGKTFHATGWKIGYCVAPPALSAEFRKIHQFLVFAVNSPAQHALARYLQDSQSWRALAGFFQPRRDLLAAGLQEAGFKLIPSAGTYFQLADYSAIRPDLTDLEFARWLTIEHKVASIPLSPFSEQGSSERLVRFCFAKQESTLATAIGNLQALR